MQLFHYKIIISTQLSIGVICAMHYTVDAMHYTVATMQLHIMSSNLSIFPICAMQYTVTTL